MRLHVEVLFTHDTMGRMLNVNEVAGGVAPRFFLGRTTDGNEWRFRVGLEAVLVRRLEAICMNEPVCGRLSLSPSGSSEYARLLAQDAPVERISAGPAYRFPEALSIPSGPVVVTKDNIGVLQSYFADWIEDIVHGQPFLALVRDDQAVSVCYSARKTSRAHEAGVETHPDYRGRGYAGQVVSAWADAVRRMGRMPLYSTSWENVASQAVASKLGLIQYGADLHIT